MTKDHGEFFRPPWLANRAFDKGPSNNASHGILTVLDILGIVCQGDLRFKRASGRCLTSYG